VVIFREAFSHDLSIHPSIVPLSIHGWHHTGKKTLAKINNPSFCACVVVWERHAQLQNINCQEIVNISVKQKS
jgi:hypothetical protein